MRPTKYTVKTTAQFKEDCRLATARGLDMRLLEDVIEKLALGETLPRHCRDRAMAEDSAYRQCRVGGKWLLVYRIDEGLLVLTLTRTGKRGALFGREKPEKQKGAAAMRTPLILKQLLRSPLKTAVTFLLIAVLIFSLFIQMSEYFKTEAEFKTTVDSYSGTGYVEYRPAVYKGGKLAAADYIWTDPRLSMEEELAPFLKVEGVRYPGNPVRDGETRLPKVEEIRYPALSAETVEEIASLPYVSDLEKRYMTAGVSPDYMRMKEDVTRYDYNRRIIVEGTVERVSPGEGPWPSTVHLRDPKILAGDATLDDILYDNGTIRVWAYNYESFPYGPDNYREGERYAVVCLFARGQTNRGNGGLIAENFTRESLVVGDGLSEHFCPAVWNITDAPENYLELPEYAPLQKLVEITRTDLYTFDVVYAEDMSAIRRLHDNTLYLAEGRWLTPEDTANGAKVCVVDSILAKKYNLELGERLSLNLGHTLFEQFYSLGAIACTEERFAADWTADEFEIVGFYTGSTISKDANEPNWAYSMNTVFVPLSSLPLTQAELAGHEFYPGEITFRVEEAWDIGPFLAESAPQLEAMGLTLNFDDGGWMEVLQGYQDARRIPMIRMILLAFVTVTGLALSVYLFVSRKKKDYAIMRALGTPKAQAGKALLLPITGLTAVAVACSLVAGIGYSRIALGTVLPLPAAICVVGALACTLLFAGFNLHRLSKRPPLDLLQNTEARTEKIRADADALSAAATEDVLYVRNEVRLNTQPLPITRRPASLGFRLRYVARHIRRQGFKSLLAVLLAALLVGAVIQFASLRSTYNELRETTNVTVRFVNSMSQARLRPLEEDGLTEAVYYERSPTTSCLYGTECMDTQMVITSDIGRFLNQNYTVTLGEGYTEEDIGKPDHVLVGANFMERNDIHPGDVLRFGAELDFLSVFHRFTKEYLEAVYYSKGLEPETQPTRAEVYEKYQWKIDGRLDLYSAKAVVIGSITTETGVYQDAVFTAGLDNTTSLVGMYQTMPVIEFTLADNTRLKEMRQRGEEMTGGREGAFVMDSEALEGVIRTSDLLNGLYMPVIALALLIGAAMCALLVLQNTKDAAIMRAQGTTKRTTRQLLASEQIILGTSGALLGLWVMLAWKREEFAAIALHAGLFAAVYVLILVLGSFVSGAVATKKNILELLQTKE